MVRSDPAYGATLPPFRPVGTAVPAVTSTACPSGVILLRDPRPFVPPSWTLPDRLQHWAAMTPDHVMLAQRGDDGDWCRISYAQMLKWTHAIAQGLLDLGLRYEDAIMILSGNSLEHAAMALGAMTIGVVVAPISPAYALNGGDYARLQRVYAAASPTLIFVQDEARFSAALAALNLGSIPVVAVKGAASATAAIAFEVLRATKPRAELGEAIKAVTSDTVAKLLFTSGSTGSPKGVPNTHAMMAASVEMADATLGWSTSDKPDETLCWLPWNHTMAGNVVFNLNLHHGETYYIDDGRPLPGAYDRTLRNWRDVSPRIHRDVPIGYAMLAEALEADDALCRHFFARLVYLLYAGASLPNAIYERFQALAIRVTGSRIPFFSGFGSTEAAPGVLQTYWPNEDMANVGIPLPGLEVKLVPLPDGRYEVRVRGPNVMAGYVREPAVNAAAFDADGFYKMGDAVRFAVPGDPLQGLRFAGRLSEDFKLLTGTFVNVGALRLALVEALAPLARDVVVTGHDRAFVGALIFADLAACRALSDVEALGADDATVIRAPAVVRAIAQVIAAYNQQFPASSRRIARFAVLAKAPDVDAGEMTDKGYVNQAAVLLRRAAIVDALYADATDPDVHFCDFSHDRIPA